MRILKASLFLFIIFLTQTVVFSRISVFGANLDMLLVVVIIWGLLEGPLEGFWVGLICGFFADVFSSPAYVSTAAMAIAGLSFGILRERIFRDGQFVMPICVFIGSFTAYLIGSWILSFFYQKELSDFFRIAVLSSILNMLVTPVISTAVYKISSHEE